ncbi:hypothetical protein GE061_007630 [Apolygus lucorum]|uniref:Uncharacterized protein n=1 Tax=Apolygus lucorum TaxID=248454 RepID=A0A8S9WNZ9_APOLU|nr:hypothetical protein GE061_007630 [Apolygus lucorum]
MVRCKRIFGLGIGYVQALILSMPFSVDGLMWHIIQELIEEKHGSQEIETIKSELRTFSLNNVRRSRGVMTGLGRMMSLFVIQKVNNKFLILGITIAEVVFLIFSHSLYLAYGGEILAWSYLFVVFFQGTRFPFALNILAKWTLTRRMTSLFSTFILAIHLLLSLMVILVQNLTLLGQSSVLLHIYATVTIKTLFIVIWAVFGAADPMQSLFVPLDELAELRKGNPRRIKTHWKNTVPWKKIFTTPILYGSIFFDIGCLWGHEIENTVLLDPVAMYLEENSVVALVGYYFWLAAAFFTAFLVDFLIHRGVTT